MVGQMVLGWTGMARRFGGAGHVGAHTIGALYVLSPFMTTRAAVGHFMITVPFAVLPWVLPTLARPGRRLGSTFLAASLLSIGGHFGGSLAVARRGRVLSRSVPTNAGCPRSWSPWPPSRRGSCRASPSGSLRDANRVRRSCSRPSPTVRPTSPACAAGGGYWNTYFQIGATATAGVIVGRLLARAGRPRPTRRAGRAQAVVGGPRWGRTRRGGVVRDTGGLGSVRSRKLEPSVRSVA